MGDRLLGKVAVVTGGASGIGEATVKRFVEEGARVVVADIQADRGAALVASLGDVARFAACDVTDEAQVAAAITTATDTWGRLDCMFNNAGIVGAIGPIAETDSAAWLRTIDILLHSVFYGSKHAARVMIPQGSGSIISTSSVAGVIGGLGPHAYTAAKHAVVGLTKSIASEVGRHGVRCNAIAPGTIPTPLTAQVVSGDPTAMEQVNSYAQHTARTSFVPDPSDIANAALYLASDEARLVSGHTLVVDAGRSVNGGSARFATAEPGTLDATRPG
ncbi:MAG: SDR family oxidoreductase [Acidimicrobiaceae bacterium]|nr:SDR family oxidoreductase [Acidimicrobiaceae bacterium]